MCAPDAPPAPDYTGAAEATAAGNLDAARVAAKANRVSQYTPYGNIIYTPGVNGDQDQWRADVTLSPAQQYLLDRQNQTSMGLADTMNQGVDYVQDMMANPFDQSALPREMVNSDQTGQDAIMSRLQPQIEQDREALASQLANQGITLGSEAWQNAQRQQGQKENDLRTQAALRGIDIGQQARQQAIQEQAFFRNEPINTLNAVRTGAQVQSPTFSGTPQQATTGGPDLLGGVGSQYSSALGQANAEAAAKSNQAAGAASLIAALFASDRRLKTNIKRIGTHNTGIGIYTWTYVWGEPGVGVMADEVEKVIPDAVHTGPHGYKMVDYSKV